VINTHSLHNTHLLRRALPRDLTAPIPLIDPNQRQAEHAKLAGEWRKNPKSHTAQGQAREKKRADLEAKKGKKRAPRGEKRSVDEAFEGWEGFPKEELKEEMVLISELDAPLPFLAGVYNDAGGSQLGFETAGLDL